jgi:hypothetical protein
VTARTWKSTSAHSACESEEKTARSCVKKTSIHVQIAMRKMTKFATTRTYVTAISFRRWLRAICMRMCAMNGQLENSMQMKATAP